MREQSRADRRAGPAVAVTACASINEQITQPEIAVLTNASGT